MENASSKPLALEAYEQLAEAYAAVVDTKPHNAYYDRPAVLSLLPPVAGKRVLDAGCGPGAYSEWLVKHSADVTALDASPSMVRLARERLGDTVNVQQADLGQPLRFPDAMFELIVSPLVLDYIEDWDKTFSEFHRVLRTDGHLVFSVGHPFWDFVYFKSDSYFATELVGMEWKGFSTQVYMPCYRRPLQAVVNPLLQTGFVLERILEPQPTPEFAEADPQGYARLMRRPNFICVRARRN